MLITNKKIKVTYKMMEDANMTRITPRGLQLGIPVDPKNKHRGLRWKTIAVDRVTDEDFDKIEEYFLIKKKCKDDNKMSNCERINQCAFGVNFPECNPESCNIYKPKH